jgi:prephenate dehydratase
MTQKVAIQGFEGSFHQVATQRFFGAETEVATCATFREVIRKAEEDPACSGALMAIENSIAGSILPNYNLLQQSSLKIVGEVYLAISQNLLVNPGVQLADIKEVHSHPMALLQCQDFLGRYNWKLVETEDTALSARFIHEHQHKHIAGIASLLAAELYQLDVAVAGIQAMKHNYTRFLVLSNTDNTTAHDDADKASVYFKLLNEKGSLAKVLQVIAACDVNLSKLQSFPIPGSNWQYSFHADLEFGSASQINDVLDRLKIVTTELKVYGIYRRGDQGLQLLDSATMHLDKNVQS